MHRRPRIAAILQYSESLFKEIEDYLLRVYASAFFIPTLKVEAKRNKERLDKIKEKVELTRMAVEELRKGFDPGALEVLAEQIMAVAAGGALAQFGIRPDRLILHLTSGNQTRANKYLDRIIKLADALEEEAEATLAQGAKKMKEDIKKWAPYEDKGLAAILEEMRRRGEPPDLEIQLKEDDFPFLDEKFKKRIQRARGPKASVVDRTPSFRLLLRILDQIQAGGAWSGEGRELIINLPPFAPYEFVRGELRRVLKHELRHMTQTVMARALGIDKVRINKDGDPVYQYIPSPGMASQDLIDPEVVQALRFDVPQVMDRRRKLLKRYKLRSERPFYTLDDLEFYTQLADRVVTFEEFLDEHELTPEQQQTAFNLFTNRLKVPKAVQRFFQHGSKLPAADIEEAKQWLDKTDPGMGVFSLVVGPDDFFRHLNWYQPEKWKKAVKEFAKAIEPKMKAAEPKKGLEALWERFLKERYEGGKAKIRNPNPKTRDRYDEISINYLMKQKDPAYQSARQKIRREFAAWHRRHVPKQMKLFQG